jgi:hypothetical protein
MTEAKAQATACREGSGAAFNRWQRLVRLSRQATLERWCHVVQTRPWLIALVAWGLTTVFSAGLTLRRATTPWSDLPDYDYWGSITGLVTERGVTLDPAALFRHNNEHVVVIPKLIYMANYYLTSGSNIGLIVYSLAAGAVCALLLLWFARDLLRDEPTRWALCAILFPLVIFSAKLSHSYYFGMSGTIWLTADIFVILSAAAMARAAQAQSAGWLFASLLAALLGLLAYSTAIYSLFTLLLFCAAFLLTSRFRGRIPWPVLAAVIAIVVTAVSIWLAFLPHPKGHPPLDFDPIGLAGFVIVYLGSPLAEGYAIPVAGLVIVICGALAIRYLIAQGRGSDIFLWVTLALFAPFNALMTGIGRLGFGIQAAASGRYQSVTAVSLMATVALVLAALPKQGSSRHAARVRAAALICMAAMGLFLVVNSKSIKFYADRLEDKPVAEIAWRQNLAGDWHLAAATPVVRRVQGLFPALRATRHVPFNRQTRCEALLTQRPDYPASQPVGSIEHSTIYDVSSEPREAVELRGWVPRSESPPECIVIVDSEGTAIGAGALGSRPPVGKPQDDSKVAWRAVALYPARLPICALALVSTTSALEPIGSCLASLGHTELGASKKTRCVSHRGSCARSDR